MNNLNKFKTQLAQNDISYVTSKWIIDKVPFIFQVIMKIT